MLALLVPGVQMGGGGTPLEGRNALGVSAHAGGIRSVVGTAGASTRGHDGTAGAP